MELSVAVEDVPGVVNEVVIGVVFLWAILWE